MSEAAGGFLDSKLSPLPFYHEGFEMATSCPGRGHFGLLFPLMPQLRIQDAVNGLATIQIMLYFKRQSSGEFMSEHDLSEPLFESSLLPPRKSTARALAPYPQNFTLFKRMAESEDPPAYHGVPSKSVTHSYSISSPTTTPVPANPSVSEELSTPILIRCKIKTVQYYF